MIDIETLLDRAIEGRYRRIRVLGEGGMAVVYLAEDLKHRRQVALKVLRPELAQSVGPARFQREIETAARLQHPHILTVFDSGESGGLLWFTMPYVEGESLRARLERDTQLPIEEAIRIAREAAQALHYAHEHGVVHRDIKPDNILLARDGSTLVADFGISRALGDTDERTSLTQTGTSIGTPAYMSPEQASGERVIDARSDIYALGAVLYEMLAGEPPYTGPTAQVIISRRFTVPVPSVRATRSTVSAQLDQTISRALALVPGDRFATAAELGAALAASTRVPHAAAAAPSRRWLLRGGVAVALLVAAGAAFQTLRGGPEPAGLGAVVDSATPRIAVLPFENRGDSADAYFADGMTDAVRGKLAMLPGLEVIARNSTSSYAGTTKTYAEIAAELGVRYLLTAVVRWERRGANESIVHVTPELTEIRPDGPPTAKWQQSFDQPLTNVFQVQAEIAGEVASKMQVALAASDRSNLAATPTSNPAAYDAFLRAETLRLGPDVAAIRRAVRYAEQAVALDSNFAEAWAILAISRSNLYAVSRNDQSPELARKALEAAQRGLALDPSIAETHRAMGGYYRAVAMDDERAFEYYRAGFERDPGDVGTMASLSIIHSSRGEFEQAAGLLETAMRIDPRMAHLPLRLSYAYQRLGQNDEAEEAGRRAMALDPGNAEMVANLVALEINRGRLTEARQMVRAAAPEMDSVALFSHLAMYGDFFWVLDSAAQQVVMNAPLIHYGGLKIGRDLVGAQIWASRGNQRLAAIWADSAVTSSQEYIAQNPEDGEMIVLQGLALAYLGRGNDARNAVAAARRTESHPDVAEYIEHVAARIYIILGDHDAALDILEDVIDRRADGVTPARLRIDTNFDPVRDEPRFRKLVSGNS